MTEEKSRLLWVDNVKVIACFLVVIGHFFQSMTVSGIIPEAVVYNWFEKSIYCFHVYLFFVCSGYLYQKFSKVYSLGSWYKNVLRKLVALGIPYFTFSAMTLVMKYLASDVVNNKANDFIYTLFAKPTAPYWYLYTLFFLFLIIPCFKSRQGLFVLTAVAVGLKIINLCGITDGLSLPFFVESVLSNAIWFALGMLLTQIKPVKGRKYMIIGLLLFILFILLSIGAFYTDIFNSSVSFVLGLLACLGIILFFQAYPREQTIFGRFMTKYNLPIFLMHTIFAAGIRIVLLKFGITSWYIHVPAGLIITFAGPTLTAFIMNKLKYPNFLLYPLNFIKLPKE